MAKKKPTYMQRRGKEEINKKALIWIGSIIAALIVIMAVLIIVQR